MDCHAAIDTILEAYFHPVADAIHAGVRSKRALADLPAGCVPALIARIRTTLDTLDPPDPRTERVLQLLLAGLLAHDRAVALTLVATALDDARVHNKEGLVDIVDDLEDRRVIPVLLRAITVDTSTGDMAGYAREKAIRALSLRDAAEASPVIIPYLADPVERVRHAAVRFCLDLHVAQAAPRFIERLGPGQEDDLDILTLLVRGVVRWRRVDALPALRALRVQAAAWTAYDPDLLDEITAAITTLEQGQCWR